MYFSHQVVSELLHVFKLLMNLRSVPLLEEAYRHVLGDLELTFNTLLEHSESDFQCSLVASNPYAGAWVITGSTLVGDNEHTWVGEKNGLF